MLPEISTPFAFLDWQSKEEKESLLQGFDKGLGTGPINRL